MIYSDCNYNIDSSGNHANCNRVRLLSSMYIFRKFATFSQKSDKVRQQKTFWSSKRLWDRVRRFNPCIPQCWISFWPPSSCSPAPSPYPNRKGFLANTKYWMYETLKKKNFYNLLSIFTSLTVNLCFTLQKKLTLLAM